MDKLEGYLKKMGKLRVDHNKNRYTSGKAPHKPTLLLSLIILYENDRVDLENVKPSLDLRETWSELWNCLEYPKAGPIHLPMYHMKSDGFWNLDFKDGVVPNQPKSLSNLELMVNRISMDENLIRYIEGKRSRDRIISSILNGGYYSEEERGKLKKKIEEIDISFDYESELIQQVKKEFVPEAKLDTEEFLPVRSPAFRRIVLGAYDETCAVCGMNIQTASGISVIDAAHILPFNKFHNDDIRNGLALCKMHHWLFDRGILSVDNHYRVMVSRNIETEHPDNIVSRFHREDLGLPEETNHYPHHKALEWHRKNVFDS